MQVTQEDECGSCKLCAPWDWRGVGHVFRKREHAKDKRKASGGRGRQEKRLLGRRKCRNTPCDCWGCQPGYMKRRVLQERDRRRESRLDG